MTIDMALESILGRPLAKSISESMGQHWAVVAAMAQATTDDNPHAVACLRAWVKAQRTSGQP